MKKIFVLVENNITIDYEWNEKVEANVRVIKASTNKMDVFNKMISLKEKIVRENDLEYLIDEAESFGEEFIDKNYHEKDSLNENDLHLYWKIIELNLEENENIFFISTFVTTSYDSFPELISIGEKKYYKDFNEAFVNVKKALSKLSEYEKYNTEIDEQEKKINIYSDINLGYLDYTYFLLDIRDYLK